MANKKDNYKKIRIDIINGKKRCIYMKPKGKREYVKSKGEFVLLSVYINATQKKNKKRVVRGGGEEDEDLIKAMNARATMRERVNNRIINSFRKSNAFVSGLLNKKVPYEPEINERWEKPSWKPDEDDLHKLWYKSFLHSKAEYLQNNKSKKKAEESYEKGKQVRQRIISALKHKDKKVLPYNISADLVYPIRPHHIEEE